MVKQHATRLKSLLQHTFCYSAGLNNKNIHLYKFKKCKIRNCKTSGLWTVRTHIVLTDRTFFRGTKNKYQSRKSKQGTNNFINHLYHEDTWNATRHCHYYQFHHDKEHWSSNRWARPQVSQSTGEPDHRYTSNQMSSSATGHCELMLSVLFQNHDWFSMLTSQRDLRMHFMGSSENALYLLTNIQIHSNWHKTFRVQNQAGLKWDN